MKTNTHKGPPDLPRRSLTQPLGTGTYSSTKDATSGTALDPQAWTVNTIQHSTYPGNGDHIGRRP